MSTFTNFTITVPFADFSAENWEALVRDSTNPENTSWDEVKMLMCHMMENTHLNNIIFFYFILLLIFHS